MVANRRKYSDRAILQWLDCFVKVTPVLRVKSSKYKIARGDQKCRRLIANLIDDSLAGLGVSDDLSIGFMDPGAAGGRLPTEGICLPNLFICRFLQFYCILYRRIGKGHI